MTVAKIYSIYFKNCLEYPSYIMNLECSDSFNFHSRLSIYELMIYRITIIHRHYNKCLYVTHN